jgi:hypothetical protein
MNVCVCDTQFLLTTLYFRRLYGCSHRARRGRRAHPNHGMHGDSTLRLPWHPAWNDARVGHFILPTSYVLLQSGCTGRASRYRVRSQGLDDGSGLGQTGTIGGSRNGCSGDCRTRLGGTYSKPGGGTRLRKIRRTLFGKVGTGEHQWGPRIRRCIGYAVKGGWSRGVCGSIRPGNRGGQRHRGAL